MVSFELLRHYIFINPIDINSDIHQSEYLTTIKKEHNKYYVNNEKITYWNYNEIASLLKDYDTVLYDLFMQLNTNYAALLADIGRYVILYFYGGIYSDLKCMSNKKMIDFLGEMKKEGVLFIAESHPTGVRLIRNGNIISLYKKHQLLDDTLQYIKHALIEEKKQNTKGPEKVWQVGSKIYIDLFTKNRSETVINIPLLKEGYIIWNASIHSSRIAKWQSTVEYLFKQS